MTDPIEETMRLGRKWQTETDDGRDFAARLKKSAAQPQAEPELRESLSDDDHHVLLLSETRALLEDLIDQACDGSSYNKCRFCLTSLADKPDTVHTEWCLVTRARELLGRMAQEGYTE